MILIIVLTTTILMLVDYLSRRRRRAEPRRSPDVVCTEAALDPLGNRPDFRALMMDLVVPIEPFAGSE